MEIKKRMRRGVPSTALPRICRGPLREVVHIEFSDTKRGGIKWTLNLSCGHLATRYAKNRQWGAPQMKPLSFAPWHCRCTACGILAKKR